MTIDAVIYNPDPFIKNHNYDLGMGSPHSFDHFFQDEKPNAQSLGINGEVCSMQSESCAGGLYSRRRKRRRVKVLKNKEEMERQRMTHIAVERNRRRQMNEYLAVLRSLMPPSYAQRGDQASIVGGAINFVKELEQLLQSLEAHKLTDDQEKATNCGAFSDFFTFPQYSSTKAPATVEAAVERRSGVADVEVTMVESHANIKILSKRRPKQLLKLVAGFQSISLNVLHLNVTTVDQSVLYSFSVKVEEKCEFMTVNEMATAVHEMVGMIQEESTSSPDNPPHEYLVDAN